jgi:hypothetical protein
MSGITNYKEKAERESLGGLDGRPGTVASEHKAEAAPWA